MTTKTQWKRVADYIGAPDYSRRRWQWFIVVLIITVTADLLTVDEHAVFSWEQLPLLNSVLGFVSCLLIIFVSKFLGHYCGLMQREDYYDENE